MTDSLRKPRTQNKHERDRWDLNLTKKSNADTASIEELRELISDNQLYSVMGE